MNLQQLISQPDLDEVEFRNVMLKYYPKEDPEVFFNIMSNLFKEDVVDNPDRQINLGRYVEKYDEEEEEYEFVDVGLDVISERKHYSLSFIPWKEILGYGVDDAIKRFVDTKDMTREEVIAHILVEITFYGYDAEKIDDVAEALRQQMKEIDEMKKNDPNYLDKLYTMEDVFGKDDDE